MPDVLLYLMNQSDEQFKRQIQYILEQLNTPSDVADVSQDGREEEEESNGDD